MKAIYSILAALLCLTAKADTDVLGFLTSGYNLGPYNPLYPPALSFGYYVTHAYPGSGNNVVGSFITCPTNTTYNTGFGSFLTFAGSVNVELGSSLNDGGFNNVGLVGYNLTATQSGQWLFGRGSGNFPGYYVGSGTWNTSSNFSTNGFGTANNGVVTATTAFFNAATLSNNASAPFLYTPANGIVSSGTLGNGLISSSGTIAVRAPQLISFGYTYANGGMGAIPTSFRYSAPGVGGNAASRNLIVLITTRQGYFTNMEIFTTAVGIGTNVTVTVGTNGTPTSAIADSGITCTIAGSTAAAVGSDTTHGTVILPAGSILDIKWVASSQSSASTYAMGTIEFVPTQ